MNVFSILEFHTGLYFGGGVGRSREAGRIGGLYLNQEQLNCKFAKEDAYCAHRVLIAC